MGSRYFFAKRGEVIEVNTESETPSTVTVNAVKHLGFNAESKNKFGLGDETIGSGFYGEVFKGTFLTKPPMTVAVKQPSSDCAKETFKTVLSETKVLRYLGSHKNVVRFIGAYTQEIDVGIIYIVLEFCDNGSLDTYLRTIKESIDTRNYELLLEFIEERPGYTKLDGTTSQTEVDLEELLRFSKKIAAEMEYISKRKVVSADLSAINVLLDANNMCKITDFGLSRKLYERNMYKKEGKEQMPWFWLALEGLKSKEFTTKSDVCSFGVVLWEIFTLGEQPFSGISMDADFIKNLETGLRMQKPEHAHDDICEKLLLCWDNDLDNRPSFTELSEFFEDFFESFL